MNSLFQVLISPASRQRILFVASFYLFNFSVVHAQGQYVQFSTAGNSTNLDSSYQAVLKRHPPRLNSALYRDQAEDSLSRRASVYTNRYRETLHKKGSYQHKYDSMLSQVARYRGRALDYWVKSKDVKGLFQWGKSRVETSDFGQKHQGYLEQGRQVQRLADQFLSGKLKLDSGTVLNNKLMKSYLDSLSRRLPHPPINPFTEVPKEELVEEVNQRFSHGVDSLRDSSKWVSEGRKRKEWFDLNYARLKSADRSSLKPMAVSLVSKEVLKHLDSVRLNDLKAARMKMGEAERRFSERVTYIKEKQSGWDKSYIEAILGLSSNNNLGYQFSPAFAYHVTPALSFGGGPNVVMNKKAKENDFEFGVGFRGFTKYEVFHRTAYLQAEDRMAPGFFKTEDGWRNHQVLVGGGYVIPVLTPITLNVSIMYRVYTSGSEPTGSAWLFRVGISTNKKRN